LCGRFSAISETDVLKKRFKVKLIQKKNVKNLRKKYNIAPGDWARMINSNRELEVAKWGLLPDSSYSTFNAKAETLEEKQSFAPLFKNGQRCLIPSDGFYEFPVGEFGKRSMRLALENDKTFSYAGLYRESVDSVTGQVGTTFTIITCEPNEIVHPTSGLKIHDRMPVILHEGDEDAWLDSDTSIKNLKGLLKPYRGSDMLSYEVSSFINKTKNEGETCWLGVDQVDRFDWL